MGGGNWITNLNLDLSKPATVFLEKISDAVGGVLRPYQIVRVAKAEAEADRIHAESQIQISDLQRRAMYRFFEEEGKRQQNIEEITRKALPQLEGTAKPEKVEDDWIVNFFERCRLISDEDMQQLWSRVLAGEANAPGSFSKRTVNSLASLDKLDAKLFTEICTFGWHSSKVFPLVYDFDHPIYRKHGIHFGALSHLDSVGLINFNPLGEFARKHLPKSVAFSYYGKSVNLELLNECDNQIQVGKAMLTRIGAELAPICGSQPDYEFFEYILEHWKGLGYLKGNENAKSPLP
jgi:uncharacterized protein DUF2806